MGRGNLRRVLQSSAEPGNNCLHRYPLEQTEHFTSGIVKCGTQMCMRFDRAEVSVLSNFLRREGRGGSSREGRHSAYNPKPRAPVLASPCETFQNSTVLELQ